MPALLILLCVALGVLMLRSASGAEARLGRREALLASAVLVALFATAVAELSSLLWRFDRSVVIGAWLFFSVLLAAGIWRARPGPAATGAAPALARPSRQEVAFLLGLALLFAAVALTAGAAAPNAWDSMTYHLPRI